MQVFAVTLQGPVAGLEELQQRLEYKLDQTNWLDWGTPDPAVLY